MSLWGLLTGQCGGDGVIAPQTPGPEWRRKAGPPPPMEPSRKARARPCPDEILSGASEPDFNSVTAAQICRTAAGLVVGERADQHGDWLKMFEGVAALWSAFLGVEITPAQAALMMVQFKVARANTGKYNPDDFVDIAGYGGGAGEIAARDDAKSCSDWEDRTARGEK